MTGPHGPMSSDRFRDRLGKAGVTSVLMARNSALAAFAADVPPALLADKLGLSISSAVEWSKAVAAVRADYTGLRDGRGPAARKRSRALLPTSVSSAHLHPQVARPDGILITGPNGDLPVRPSSAATQSSTPT